MFFDKNPFTVATAEQVYTDSTYLSATLIARSGCPFPVKSFIELGDMSFFLQPVITTTFGRKYGIGGRDESKN